MRIVTKAEAYEGFQEEYVKAHEFADYPEGFRERLAEKTIEEQAALFAVVENVSLSKSYYGETENTRYYEKSIPLEKFYEFEGLIVDNGLIHGILVKTPWGITPLTPYEACTTYYADDNEGSGSSCREDTATLICLPPAQAE